MMDKKKLTDFFSSSVIGTTASSSEHPMSPPLGDPGDSTDPWEFKQNLLQLHMIIKFHQVMGWGLQNNKVKQRS